MVGGQFEILGLEPAQDRLVAGDHRNGTAARDETGNSGELSSPGCFASGAGTATGSGEAPRIAKRVDKDGDEQFDRSEAYVYDETGKFDPASGLSLHDILLIFGDGSLASRYLHGPGIDQVLAAETLAAGGVLWYLGDNQNTTRDVAAYDEGEDETSVVNHLAYNSFGEIT